MYLIKIPKSVKVGGFSYKVRASKRIDAELRDAHRRGSHSEFLRELDIASSSSPQEESCTLIHEILHAVDTVYLNGALEEGQVTSLSNGIHQVLEQLKVRFVL